MDPSSMGPNALRHGAQQDRGENARLQAFVGAMAIGDLVKTTLGPKGMDKILLSQQGVGGDKITVTNDGATILRSIWIDNPAAQILVDISKNQDDEIGDGTTSVVVLAAQFLRKAEDLVQQKIHPQIIIEGFRLAQKCAVDKLETLAFDNGLSKDKFREDLLDIARTTLSSKLVKHEKELFATLCVDAVLRLNNAQTGNDLTHIQILKKQGGSLNMSYLEDGFLLEKKIGVGMPKFAKDCKILVANTPMDTDKIKIFGSKVKTDSLDTVAKIEKAEKEKMKAKVHKICETGCTVFINRQLIYNYPEQLFAEQGVLAIEHADFEGVERLAAVLGADIASTFDGKINLGACETISEIMIGEDKVIKFGGVKSGEACTIVLRGASQHVLDEADRSLHDALAVVYQTTKNTKVVYGGGACEMEMSKAVRQLAEETPGKLGICIEAFAKALEQIPLILADNGGYDSSELVGQLRAAHHQGKADYGLNLELGETASMSELRICESMRSKIHQINSASEAAEMIIRVDDIIRCVPRQRGG